MRKILISTALLAIVALAGAADAALLTDPSQPSSGKYLRLEDRAIVEYNRDLGVSAVVGWANDGLLLGATTCSFGGGSTCDSTAHAAHCTWANPDNNPWTANPTAADFLFGRCISVRVQSDRADAQVHVRAAVRLAAATFNENQAQGINGKWNYTLEIEWLDANAGAIGQQVNASGGQINPYRIYEESVPCTVNVGQQYSLQVAGHSFADCVWPPHGPFRPSELVPAGLEVCDDQDVCTAASINGFIAQGKLYRDGAPMGDARVTCRGCFTAVTSGT